MKRIIKNNIKHYSNVLNIRLAVFASVLLFSFNVGFGQIINEGFIFHNPTPTPPAPPISMAVGNSVTVKDDHFDNFDQTSDYQTTLDYDRIFGIVDLEIDRAQLTKWGLTKHTITVGLEIEYKTLSNSSGTTITHELTVEYDPSIGAKEIEVEAFKIVDAIWIRAEIKHFVILDQNGNAVGPLTTLTANEVPLVLTTSIISEPILDFYNYVKLGSGSPPTQQITHTFSSDNTSIKLSWNSVFNAEKYEIQWLYVDEHSFSGASFSYSFTNNHTNIIVPGDILHYHIPAIYESGYLVCRVRAIGRSVPDKDIVIDNWFNTNNSINESGSISLSSYTAGQDVVILNGFENNINWLGSTAFAENNLRKSAVSYYDGMFRPRQSVSYLEESPNFSSVNRIGTAIVNEQIYDFVGRPSISVLPTPSLDNSTLNFRDAFNLNTNGVPYSWEDFDVDSTQCMTSVTHAMSPVSGATKYYSPNVMSSTNSYFTSSVNRGFIPDANRYPFAQVEYTADPTGRVRKQGGVGINHQLTAVDKLSVLKDGHNTRVHYGKPKDAELFILFGNDVGDESHYQKVVTIDPNNQISIAYIDAAGRTIATALAGDPTLNSSLLPLDGDKVTDNALKTLPLNYQSRKSNDYELTYEEKFYALQPGTHKFEYTFDLPRYEEDCLEEQICYTCIYTLSISIIDECGNEKILNGPITEVLGSPDPITNVNTTCQPITFTLSPAPLDVDLLVGEYTIKKTLKLDPKAMEAYEKLYFSTEACFVKTLDDFVAEEEILLDKRFCDYDCEKCNEDKTAILAVRDALQTGSEDWEDANKLYEYYNYWCHEMCTERTPCVDLYQNMLQDMSPMGQYAEFSQGISGYTYPATNCILVETSGNGFNGDSWRNPERYDQSGNPISKYLTPDGQEDLIKAIGSTYSGFYPYINNASNYVNDAGAPWQSGDGDRYIKPQDLLNVELFIQYWQPYWAESLIYLHPEYCLYEKCIEIQGTYRFNNQMNKISSGKTAKDLGYFNPLNSSYATINWATYDADPAVSSVPDSLFYVIPALIGTATIEDNLMEFPQLSFTTYRFSIWEILEEIVKQYDENATVSTFMSNECNMDILWEDFRGLYQSAKALALVNYYNGCNTNISNSKQRRFYYDVEKGFSDLLTGTDNVVNGQTLAELYANFMDLVNNPSSASQVKNIATNQCVKQCESYKPDWKERLLECKTIGSTPLSHGDPNWELEMDDLLDDLASICQGGCDVNHPYGSRQSVNGYNLGDPYDFSQAIALHFQIDDEKCNDLLLTWPMNYDHDYLSFDDPESSKCACEYTADKLALKRQDCPDYKEGLEAFENCACEENNEAIKDRLLNTTYIENDYRCNTCKSCEEVQNEALNYLVSRDLVYPNQDMIDYFNQNSIPLPSLPDYSDPIFQKLLTNHLNLNLGLNLFFEDYLAFLSDCHNLSESSVDVFEEIKYQIFFAQTDEVLNEQSPSDLPFDGVFENSKLRWATTENKSIGPKMDPITELLLKVPTLSPSDLVQSSIKWRSSDEININTQWASLNHFYLPEIQSVQTAPTSQQIENVKCNCEKILNSWFYAEKTGNPNWTTTFSTLYPGSGITPDDDMKKMCCLLSKSQPIPSDPSSETCDPDLYSPGNEWPSEFDSHLDEMMNQYVLNYPDALTLADNPCSIADECTSQMKKIDWCGCEFIMEFRSTYGTNASKELLIQKGVFLTDDEILRLSEKCLEAWQHGQGLEDVSGNETSWVPPGGIAWNQKALDALAYDSYFYTLQIPCCLGCTPVNCDMSPPPPNCMIKCDFVRLHLLTYLETNPYPNSDYKEYSDAIRTYKVYQDYSANQNPSQNDIDWFDGFETALLAAQDAFLHADCDRFTFSELIATLSDCGNPCKTLDCASITSLLTTYLQTHSFPTDVDAEQLSDVEKLDLMLALLTTSRHGYSTNYNITNIQLFMNDFASFVTTELSSASCTQNVSVTTIQAMRFFCAPKIVPDESGPGGMKCNVCYEETQTKFLEDFKVYLNKIIHGRMNEDKLDLLDKDNWYLKNPSANPARYLTSYYDHTISELYKWHSDETNLKYNLLNGYPKAPMLTGQVADATNHNLQFELYFPSGDWIYHFGEIIEFEHIELMPVTYCNVPEVFELKAVIYVPADKVQFLVQHGVILDPDDIEQHIDELKIGEFYKYNVTMYGRFVNFQIAKQVTCANKCKTLCNRPYYPVYPIIDDCEDVYDEIIFSNAQMRYEEYLADKRAWFRNEYTKTCMGAQETFKGTRPYYEYHHMLYYYDQSGALIKTVPPEGVYGDALRKNSSIDEITDFVDDCRDYVNGASSTRILPQHTLISAYQYNSLGQNYLSITPDGGESRSWFDNLGRLIASQNANQLNGYPSPGYAVIRYSYSLYDALGRLSEVGEVTQNPSNPITQAIAIDPSAFSTWLNQGSRSQVTQSFYNESPITVNLSNFVFENTRNRVVTSTFEAQYDSDDATYDHATHYTYDIRGNANMVVQDHFEFTNINNQQYKTLEYRFDLLSGNVDSLIFQRGEPDQMIHRYTYDSENRLLETYTSRDRLIERLEAKYFYYVHGPLARVELGHNSVQGIDYAYTIHGWLKTVNGEGVTRERDIGQDGFAASVNNTFAKDAFGFMLHFYNGDYSAVKSIPPTENIIAAKTGSDAAGYMHDLYNGNIQAMTTILPNVSKYNSTNNYAVELKPQMGVYRYDKLNRLKEMRVFTNYDDISHSWQNNAYDGTDAYYTNYTYDQMGNILSLVRNGGPTQIQMDQFTYQYDYMPAGQGNNSTAYKQLRSNKLFSVNDAVSTTSMTEDIEDMGTFIPDNLTTTTVNEAEEDNNFKYDRLGNLIYDKSERIDEIIWTPYGKISEIKRDQNAPIHQMPDLAFEYGPDGQRIKKIVKPRDVSGNLLAQSSWVTTYYSRDASGNVLSTYTFTGSITVWESINIYGASRLGEIQVSEDITTVSSNDQYISGNKLYELSNHLGNVLAVITDRKIAQDLNTDNIIDLFEVEYVSITDYYPFGMQMVERCFVSSGHMYNWGFQGQEKESDISGIEGGHLFYTYRIHDVRLGRFLSVDPLSPKFPYLSSYQFASNSVIMAVELEGLESSADGINTVEFSANGTLPNGEDVYVPPNSEFKRDGFGSITQIKSPDGVESEWREEGTFSLKEVNVDQRGYKIEFYAGLNYSSQDNLQTKVFDDNSITYATPLSYLKRGVVEGKIGFNYPGVSFGTQKMLFGAMVSAKHDYKPLAEVLAGLISIVGTEAMFTMCVSDGWVIGNISYRAQLSNRLRGGLTFKEYKAIRGGTKTLAKPESSTGVQRISTEFHHVFITQRFQKAYNVPNWMVNNRINVWKLNTVQHSLIDSYRYNFLRKGFKADVGWFGKYNWFTKF